MTRKEAKELFRSDKDAYGKVKAPMSKIDLIYDEFERDNLTIDMIRFRNVMRKYYNNTPVCTALSEVLYGCITGLETIPQLPD